MSKLSLPVHLALLGGGPPVSAPVQRGFASRLIERSARDQLGSEATVDFLPRGVVYTVTIALQADG